MPRQIQEEYEITAEIGSGGMATVYKAVQKSLDRPVAIKELKKAYTTDSQIVRRFERESKMAASLQHENIVHIYDYWKKPHYSIVMEYVDGVNLAEVIEKTGPLPVDVGTMIALQVCDGLDYAHMRGLIHRDIKPSNIMIKRNGEVKVMDFGIAQSRNLEALTMPGTLIGTPAYMSPEQILGQQLDSRSDIFSFGIVLYEMFTGVKPFRDDDSRSVTAKILKEKFLAPRHINRVIPWGMQWLIKKCLRKNPKRRYGSVPEVREKLAKRLGRRSTKADSLRRIAGYLVSMNVLEAAPEQEALVSVSKAPLVGRYSIALVIVALIVLATLGGLIYQMWANHSFMQHPTTQPALPSIVTSPVTRSQVTTSATPTAADAGPRETSGSERGGAPQTVSSASVSSIPSFTASSPAP
ncbi:MAG TPA: serine/threonine-protein kinase [Nitrospirota bacterium]|nr:serine/threonine-protein kinase [Nitrospirota bacterium]